MKKISIIIPCYNAEQTINRCAASLLEQTIGREGLELIFVNDGSTDHTYECLLEIEAKYPEEVLIVNLEENMGQGAARNAGLSYAGGKYTGFVDADDYVERDMYESLYQAAEQYGCDMAGGGYIRDAEEQTEIVDSLPQGAFVVVDTLQKRRELILSGTSVTFAARIYRTDFIREHSFSFPEHMLYEDNYWQSLVNAEIGSYYICGRPFYHYVETADSSTRHMTEENFLQSMKMQVLLLEEYKKRGILEIFPVELTAKFLKSHTIMNLLGMYLEWEEIPESIYLKMKEDIEIYFSFPMENQYLWRADLGLLEDLFSEKLTAQERNLCMRRYMDLLQRGRVEEWTSLFAARREERRVKKQEEEQRLWASYQEQCFELGRHAKELQEAGTFMEQTELLLQEAKDGGFLSEGAAYMEQMISHQGDYRKRLAAVSPILIYKGDAICYNVLNDFAERLAAALLEAGEQVEIYDAGENGVEGLTALCGRVFKAIIGFQTYLFSVRLKSGENLHDTIYGPKIHFIFDHPLWMKEHLEQGPKDYYILTHGRDYRDFVQHCFKKEVKGCYLLPPAGIGSVEPGQQRTTKRMDVTFVGTWYDYRERLAFIRNTKTKERYLANRFLLTMKKNPNLRAEEAFEKALEYYGISLDEEAFKNVLFDMKQVCFCIMTYYREKVIRCLLEQKLEIHVYGESWKHSPLASYENLICHPEVSVEESLNVYRASGVSLNIMSWHKGGFTERIANMLLCGTVAVSDQSWYLNEHFTDGKDIILFDLKEPEKLGEKIKYLLLHEEKRKKIASSGRKKALLEHTWEVRAGQLLEILNTISAKSRE